MFLWERYWTSMIWIQQSYHREIVMPAFGQTVFGQNRIWPNRSGPGHFRGRIWPNRIWPELVFFVFWLCVCFKILGVFKILCVGVVYVVYVVSSRFLGVFKIFGGCLQDFGASPLDPLPLPPERPFPKTASSAGRPHAGPPLRRTTQNFALFFLSPAGNFILSFSLRCLLVEFWWCL